MIIENLPYSLPSPLAFACGIENIFYMDKRDAQRHWFNFMNYVHYLIAHPSTDPLEEMLRHAKLGNIEAMHELARINKVDHIRSLNRILNRLSNNETFESPIEINQRLTQAYILEQACPVDKIHLMALLLDYPFIGENAHVFAQVPIDKVRSVMSLLFNEQVDIRKTLGPNNSLPSYSYDPHAIRRLCADPNAHRQKEEIIANGYGHAVNYLKVEERAHAARE